MMRWRVVAGLPKTGDFFALTYVAGALVAAICIFDRAFANDEACQCNTQQPATTAKLNADADKAEAAAIKYLQEYGPVNKAIGEPVTDVHRNAITVDYGFDQHILPALAATGYDIVLDSDATTRRCEFSQLLKIREIRYLDLEGTAVQDPDIILLSRHRNLRGLWLRKTSVTDVGLEHLAQLKSLRYLTIEKGKITAKGIASLATLPNLQFLGVEENAVSNLMLARGFPALEWFSWGGLATPRPVLTNVCVRGLPQLRGLWLEVKADSSVCIERLPALQEMILVLRGPSANSGKMAAFQVRDLPNLQSLCCVDIASDQNLEACTGLPQLRHLEIHQNTPYPVFSDRALTRISAFANLETLNLTMRTKGVTARGYEDLGRLAKLRTLELSPLYSVDAPSLRFLERLTNLETLNLKGGNLTGDIVPCLTSLAKLRSLRIADVDQYSTPEFSKLRHLESLSLGCNSSQGKTFFIRILPDLQTMRWLRTLRIEGRSLPNESQERKRLRESLIDTRVE